jgi:hypothetical protein
MFVLYDIAVVFLTDLDIAVPGIMEIFYVVLYRSLY